MGTESPNAEAIEAWDTVLFDKYVRFRHIIDEGIDAHSNATFDRLTLGPTTRALDIGCGFGRTTVELARRIGKEGHVVGLDSSPHFIASSTEHARKLGVENVSFAVKDAQLDPLGGPFDLVFSRSGTMFFANPVQAFKNMRAALAPKGRLAISVWRKREDNPWITIAEKIAQRILPQPPAIDAPTCGPGPFSMAGADLVSDQLLKAGFRRIAFERSEEPVVCGKDIDEAIAFGLALGPAGEIVRLAGEEGERKRPELMAALREIFTPLVTPKGVIAMSSAWLITAENP